MGDADELLFATEGDDAMPVLKSDSARGLEARRVEALRSSSKKQRLAASIPRFGMKLWLRLDRYLCGIMIPLTSTNR